MKHNCEQSREYIDETVDVQINLGICCFVDEIKCFYYTRIVLICQGLSLSKALFLLEVWHVEIKIVSYVTSQA